MFGGVTTEKKLEVGFSKSILGENKNAFPVKQTPPFGGGAISSGGGMFEKTEQKLFGQVDLTKV